MDAMAVDDEERDLKTAMLRGWQRRCPACSEAPMMDGGFLKVRDACPACGTELHHHRADDGPAWATILITGKLTVPLMLFIYEVWRPEAWHMAVGLSVFFGAMALWLLPRIKGAFVGLQWAKRMHGFGDEQVVAARS